MKSISIATAFFIISFLMFTSCNRKMSEATHNSSAGFNGSFESPQSGLPFNWQFYTAQTTGSGDFDVSLDSTQPKEGNQCVKYHVRKCDERGGRFSPGMFKEIEVRQGEIYRITYWLKNEGTAFMVRINAVNGSGAAPGPEHRSVETIPEWKQFDYQYTIPESMNRLRFELNVLQPGTLYIDDVRIEKLK